MYFFGCSVVDVFRYAESKQCTMQSTNCTQSRHVTLADLWFHPGGLEVHIRATKTVQFGNRSLVFPLSKAPQGHLLCPVQAMILYLQRAPRHFNHRSTVCCPRSCGLQTTSELIFCTRMRCILAYLGVNSKQFSPYNARRGEATLAYKLAMPVDTIRLIGDWGSNVILTYIEAERLLVKRALHTTITHAWDPYSLDCPLLFSLYSYSS